MPHVYVSLVKDGLTPHVAWRVAFVVPGVVICFVATAMLILCPDTPTGRWSDRAVAAEENLRKHSVSGPSAVVDVPGRISGDVKDGTASPAGSLDKKEPMPGTADAHHFGDHEAHLGEEQMLETARGEIIQKPSVGEIVKILTSPQTLVLAMGYFNSFGAELAINSILGAYYAKNFPKMNVTQQGNWAAMFGLLNGIARPLGGVVSDIVYGKTHSLWAKKFLIHIYACITGIFLIVIGVLDPHNSSMMFGLVAAMAFFLEGGNGLNFSLVPHVHPFANGVVSGITGASGNFGGIIFAIIFRYNGTNYAKVFWIIGVIGIAMNLAVCWIRPIPKGQIGGH
jgi:MFS transporter, NNP family, nitrate/nitrite transporter